MAGENTGTAAPAAQTSNVTAAPAAAPPPAPSGSEAPQTAPQGQTAKPLAAPLIKDPADFLARARARHGISPSKPAAGPSKGSETASSGSSAAPVASPTSQSASPSESATQATSAPSSSTATTEEPRDEMAARVAKLSREQREFDQRQKAFAEQQARDKAEREKSTQEHAAKLAKADTMEKAANALKSGDVAGAFKLLDENVNTSAIALQLLEQLQKEDERNMSPAEVERMIAERLKAEQAARLKAEEEEKKTAEEKRKADNLATLEMARENYMAACTGVFSRDKHPFIAAHGLRREEVVAYAESQRDDMGRMVAPAPEDLLNHFEELYRKRAEAAGWAPRAREEAKPAPSPSLSATSMTQDSGGRLAPEPTRRSLDEDRAEIRRKLRIGGVQT